MKFVTLACCTSRMATLLATTGLVSLTLASAARAQTAAPAAPAATPAPSGLIINGIKLSAQIEAGFMLAPSRPSTGLNFGHLFTDRANAAQLNQILLTAEKKIDPEVKAYQWGFKLQGMYGSDARFTQFLGVFNNTLPNQRYQFDLVEANVQARLPIIPGGVDVKIGQYATPIGFETIDPSTNPFYTHSYIFQYGLPFKHTGMLAVAHATDVVDVYAGIDTGANTTFGPLGENNSSLAGIAGLGLNLMGGKLTILALSHFGPEQSTRVLAPIGVDANRHWRMFNDILITYKATDALTLVTELNWIRDSYGVSGRAVNGFGAAQYVGYALNETVTLNARAEVWRDDSNFFVASFAGNADPVRAQQGLTPRSTIYAAPGSNTTYGSLTLGVTWKPEMPAPITGLAIRPEVRWDHAFTNNRPFNADPGAGKRGTSDSVTIGADFVLSF